MWKWSLLVFSRTSKKTKSLHGANFFFQKLTFAQLEKQFPVKDVVLKGKN
jgi:hypothetical protein